MSTGGLALLVLFGFCSYICIAFIVAVIVFRQIFKGKRSRTKSIGFFHPYCNDGGGGERVLWMMVAGIQQKYPDYVCVIYSGDNNTTADEILQKVRDRFGIHLNNEKIQFCFLQSRHWLEAKRYPFFTMAGQSLGSIVVTLEALDSYNPNIFIDSMGYSYSLWTAKLLGGCTVGAYVHYPTISTDMLSRVQTGTQSYNNRPLFARLSFLRYGKLMYYHVFAWFYGVAGSACSLVFVNSTWTKNHINSLWKIPKRTKILYPPCNTSHLSTLPLDDRERIFISIAQFRPEKDHALQVRSFARMRKEHHVEDCKLVLIGSCRHQQDQEIIDSLKTLAVELEVGDYVDFKVNVSYDELLNWYKRAQFGIHTMWCEHFGIGIVELMASGVIVVAHNSGGPKMDIIKPHNGISTGYLASTEEEYAAEMFKMLSLSKNEILQTQEAAREQSKLFSDEVFKEDFIKDISPLIDNIKTHTKVQ